MTAALLGVKKVLAAIDESDGLVTTWIVRRLEVRESGEIVLSLYEGDRVEAMTFTATGAQLIGTMLAEHLRGPDVPIVAAADGAVRLLHLHPERSTLLQVSWGQRLEHRTFLERASFAAWLAAATDARAIAARHLPGLMKVKPERGTAA
jgi:hypothetical protein